MANWIEPKYSKAQINRAGAAFREGRARLGDLAVIENWRASHAYIINTFQANLRRHARGTNTIVGQRLKRRPTILDKLHRQSGMKLSRMHDVAGCRVIFDDLQGLLDFRKGFCSSRFMHERLTEERDQFNYLDRPKLSGYRGVHDVFKYYSKSISSKPWAGLLVEIQYRTKIQHAWATAVETADLLTRSRGKFSEGDVGYNQFFSVCSEVLARYFENSKSCLPDWTDSQLYQKFRELENTHHIFRLLRNANRITPSMLKGNIKKNKNTVLIYPFDVQEGNVMLYYESFSNHKRAIAFYEDQEREWEGKADIVLVKSDDIDSVMSVFQNYFQDTRLFTRSISEALDVTF